MPGPPIRCLFLAGAITLLVGCGARRSQEGCPELPGRPTDRGSFTFVLTEPVRPPNAPVPTNDSEAILFGLVYETLVAGDCSRALVANLARDWIASGADSSWTFRLAPQASFSDGTTLRPTDVKRSWSGARRAAVPLARWTWESVPPGAIEVDDDGRLRVRAPERLADLPWLLVHPAFAVGREDASPWPLGTRGRLVEPADGRAGWVWERGFGSQPAASEIVFREMRGADPRDIAGTDADAFFVRDRRVLRYLEQLDGFRVTPFPYSRLYVLLTPAWDLARRIKHDDLVDLAERVAIAKARPAAGAGGFRIENRGPDRNADLRAPLERIVFPRDDPDALAIAERLSFLWSRGRGGPPPAIVPRRAPEFLPAVRDGRDLLYIFPVFPRLPGDSLARLQLEACAPWLRERGAALPLIETRGHLVTREGLTGFESGFDGMPRLHRAGWSEPRTVP